MISQNIFARVFHVRCGTKQGTGFLGSYFGREYFVTAAHLLKEHSKDVLIELQYQNVWQYPSLRILGYGTQFSKEYDIAVFEWLNPPSSADPMPMDSKGAIVSVDAYFLGYPYTMVSSKTVLGGWPVALVKKALFSGFNVDPMQWVLDGHNNPGFSGGPVLLKQGGNGDLIVSAVIGAYRKDYSPVLSTDNWYEETKLMAEGNSGVIFATSIEVAIQIIELSRNTKQC